MSIIYDVVDNFRFKGELVSCNEFGSGHINKTYIAVYNDNGVEHKYVVQQVNDSVFKNIDQLMKNILYHLLEHILIKQSLNMSLYYL